VNIERLKASVPGRVVQKFIADNGPVWSVAIAWGALFSMFPIILGIAAIVGLVLGFVGLNDQQLFAGFLSQVPAANRDDIARALHGTRQYSGIFGLLGLVGLYFSATSLFGTMEQAFAQVFGVKPRGLLKQRLMGVTMMLAFAALGGLTILTATLLPALPTLPDLPLPAGMMRGATPVAIQVLTGLLAGIVLYTLIYWVVPPMKQDWRHVWPGAVVSGVLFEVVGLVFPLYLSFNSGINVYGQFFATLFVLLTFFYLLGLTTVIGAEVNAVLRPAEAASAERGKARDRGAVRTLPAHDGGGRD
jgi:membrane protein